MSSVIPNNYYYFFWLVEPALTLAGGFSAIFDPLGYGRYLVADHAERSTDLIGATTRGQTLIGQLGSCFILLAMISLSLVYLLKHNLEDKPVLQEKLFKGLLIPLAIADLLHIALTLLPLPISYLKSPSQWSHILHCTVWITSGLFVARVSWLLGIGRARASSVLANRHGQSLTKPATPTNNKQRPVPLPKLNSELVVEKTVLPKEEEPVPRRRTPRTRRTPVVTDEE